MIAMGLHTCLSEQTIEQMSLTLSPWDQRAPLVSHARRYLCRRINPCQPQHQCVSSIA